MFSCFQTMWILVLLAENTTECAVSALLILVILISSRQYLVTNRVVVSNPRFWSFLKQNWLFSVCVFLCLSKFMCTSGSIWIFEYHDKSTAIFSSKQFNDLYNFASLCYFILQESMPLCQQYVIPRANDRIVAFPFKEKK